MAVVKKPRVERYEIDGHVVEMTSVPPDKRNCEDSSHMAGPAQRSKWEVRVDGVLRGFAFYPLGYHGCWRPHVLLPTELLPYSSNKLVRAWMPPTGRHGGWNETGGMWDGLMGLLRPLELYRDDSRVYKEERRRWKDRAEIAWGFVRGVDQGVAPTAEEVEKAFADAVEAKAARERKDAADKIRWARERQERAEREAREAAEREERRQEILTGLQEVLDQHGGLLSNFQRDAVCRAIVDLGGSVEGAG